MELNKFFTIGYVRRVIGIKGEMGIKLEVDNPARYKGIDAILLVKDSDANGVELVQAIVRGEELVIKIKGVTTPEDAKRFVGSTAMLPLEALPKLNNKRFYFHEIPGFKVVDSMRQLPLRRKSHPARLWQFAWQRMRSTPHLKPH